MIHFSRLLVASIVVAAIVAVLVYNEQGDAAPEPQNEANPKAFPELLDLVHRDLRVTFESRVTGDFSLFPTIYYNDPTVRMHADYQDVMREYGAEAQAGLQSIGGEGNGGDSGYLTARIASVLSRESSIAAWENAQQQALAEGRKATLDDLPDGNLPIERPSLDDWVGTTPILHDVRVGDTTASAKAAAGDPRGGGQILSYKFVKVEGQWFISYMESSWSQGDPDYLD